MLVPFKELELLNQFDYSRLKVPALYSINSKCYLCQPPLILSFSKHLQGYPSCLLGMDYETSAVFSTGTDTRLSHTSWSFISTGLDKKSRYSGFLFSMPSTSAVQQLFLEAFLSQLCMGNSSGHLLDITRGQRKVLLFWEKINRLGQIL